MPGELTHTSARATPELVGRKEILEKIKYAICDVSHAYLIEITGSGGIGKTRLVQHVLKIAPSLQDVRAAKDPVDLYHSSNHSREGLIAALYDALGGTEQEFQGYHTEKKRLEQIADLTQLSKQRDTMITAFISDLNQIARTQRLVFALDTTERLFFESDPIQKRLGLEEEKIAVLNWLLQDFLPRIENAVILLSGRTERGSLSDDLQKVSGKQFMPIPLQGLNEEEALEYFDAMIRACEESGELQDLRAASSIRKLTPDLRRKIFYSLCDVAQDDLTIRPIWLALAIDYWVVGEQLLPEWQMAVDDARAKAKQDHTSTRDTLAKGLVKSLSESERFLADEVILALGLATKGADVDLLCHILGRDKEEIQKALKTIRDLSFVKIRPDGERFFLHDEMQTILHQHVLGLPKTQPIVTSTLKRTIVWYNTRIDEHRKKIMRLYEQSEKTFYGSEEVNKERTSLYDALVEDLHYQLRLNPIRGFETYVRYSDDAIATGNESLDAQLRSEFLSFWSTRDPTWEKQDIEGLRADVEADAAVRWVKRLIERGDKPKARQLIERLRGDASDLIQASGELAEVALDVSDAHNDAYEARFDEAEDKLKRKIQELGQMPQSLRRDAILGRAHNNLGYVYRSTGRYLGAIHHYARARSIWRNVKIEGEQANTLTNLAFALAMIGEFGNAWRMGLDARDLRLISGAPPSVGLALNALARIAIEEDSLDDAIRYGDQVFPLFSATGTQRPKGLALIARAEAQRRMSAWMDYYPDQTAEQLSQAVKDAEEAIAIFDQVMEPARKVEALIEKGCAYRDWGRFRRDNPDILAVEEKTSSKVWSLEELAEKSRQALEEAQQIAKQHALHYLRVDALVNLAWLYYHLGQEDQAIQILNERVEPIIPRNYRIEHYARGLGGPPILDEKEAVLPFLTQSGKRELLRGQVAFNRFARTREENALREAITHYTLALAYDTLFRNQEFRDLRRAKNRMYERLKVLNANEMLVVYGTVESVEREYRLGTSAMREFLQRNFGPRDDFVGGTF